MSKARTPTSILAARGSWRAKSRAGTEPKAQLGEPAPPAHLTSAALEVGREIVPQLMAMGILAKTDRAALAMLCTACARWAEAEKQIEAHGAVVKSPSGYPIQNPWLAIANKAMEQIHKLSAEFGITPASRSRVAPAPPSRSSSPPTTAAIRRISSRN